MTSVRVGIVTWNTADLVDRCLAALPAALEGVDAEVVVVDNHSADDSASVAERHGVEVRRNRANLGYAKGMNAALADSDADVLVALNPDTEPPPGSLATLVRRLDEHPDAAVIVPRLLNSDGSLQHSVYRFPSARVAGAVALLPARVQHGRTGRRLWLEGGSPHDTSGPVDWAIGAVHVIRRSALEGPPYRERWFMYVEDLDLCWRLRRRGLTTWFDAETAVPHVGNASGAQAWGATRTARWLHATYDWYGLERGVLRARLWAALNVIGVVVRSSALEVAGRVRRNGEARFVARQLRSNLGLHVQKALRGPFWDYEPEATPESAASPA